MTEMNMNGETMEVGEQLIVETLNNPNEVLNSLRQRLEAARQMGDAETTKYCENMIARLEMHESPEGGRMETDLKSRTETAECEGDEETSNYLRNLAGDIEAADGDSSKATEISFGGKREELMRELKDAKANLRYATNKLLKAQKDKQEGWIGIDPYISWQKGAIDSYNNEIRNIERKLSNLKE